MAAQYRSHRVLALAGCLGLGSVYVVDGETDGSV